jgi:hypothetical protein
MLTGDGFLMLDLARFRDAFAADLPPNEAEFMAHAQVLISEKTFNTPVMAAA